MHRHSELRPAAGCNGRPCLVCAIHEHQSHIPKSVLKQERIGTHTHDCKGDLGRMKKKLKMGLGGGGSYVE